MHARAASRYQLHSGITGCSGATRSIPGSRTPSDCLLWSWIHSVKRSEGRPIVKVRRRVCNLRLDSDSNECYARILCSYLGTFFAAPRRTLAKTSSETASDCHPAERAVFRRNGMRSDLVFRALAHISNRFQLCRVASKVTRTIHKPNTGCRIQQTMYLFHCVTEVQLLTRRS